MQVATVASDLESYFCSYLRLMPLGNIDPSLAIGFYCKSAGMHLPHPWPTSIISLAPA